MKYIWPYNIGSESAKALAEALNVKRISGDKQLKYKSTIINWGNTNWKADMFPHKVINDPTEVALAANKLYTLETLVLSDVSCINFTTNPLEAQGWIDEDTVVYGRAKLNAHSGEGIEVFTFDSGFNPRLPLYTKGVMKAHEYRVHVAFGSVIDVSKKRRRDGVETNDYIRNLDNGWVFCREDVTRPYVVIIESLKAVEALGLDFGAVDILYKEKDNKAWVLEVNSAPGLQGTTLEKYKEAFNVALT